MAHEAVTKALKDAKVKYADVQQATVGYVYGKELNFFLFSVFQSPDERIFLAYLYN